MRMFDYNYIHPGFIFIPCLNMTPGGLRAQYLIPNLMPKCEWLSIHSSLPFEPRHHTIPRNQRKQSLCRTETNCRPQAYLPNPLKKSPPVERDLSPSQAHKSVPLLYQFLVLTSAAGCVFGVRHRWRQRRRHRRFFSIFSPSWLGMLVCCCGCVCFVQGLFMWSCRFDSLRIIASSS
jgi:hypothetical protein